MEGDVYMLFGGAERGFIEGGRVLEVRAGNVSGILRVQFPRENTPVNEPRLILN